MSKKPVVMISSTVNDLSEYRSMVLDACLRADTFPKMMEHLPALDADAIEASLTMVEEADIYVGIFAHRYGYTPQGYDISITEMEYNRAVERGIPILIFIIDDEVPVKPKDFDKGIAAEKLEILKEKLKSKHVVASFESPKDLRGLVINSLEQLKKQLPKEEKDQGKVWAKSLHYTSEIPKKPEPFIAHPYTLLQLKGLIGRKKELELLTDWVTKTNYQDYTIFNVVAIGGMGKSALTWHWFNNIAPQEKDWAGSVWWSFYETDATFDNFITNTLAYVSDQSKEQLKDKTAAEKEAELLQILNNHPYLIVLDGLERILVAYARQDAAFLDDDSALDNKTNNYIAGAMGLPESGAKSYVGKHRLRKTTDPRIGHFLRKLSQVQKSKILISTRLYPADLQTAVGEPYLGCFARFLPGLSDPDALELWRAYGAKGSREEMLPVFQSFDKHPLLLQLLASEIAEFRDAPGDFDKWKKANPDFNVFNLPLVQVQSHVLSYALKGLSTAELQTLQTIAGFRMPASIATLKALLLEKENEEKESDTSSSETILSQAITKLKGLFLDNEIGKQQTDSNFYSEASLDQALKTLEDKGLLGWDRRSNRYDLHPIVRGVVWNNLDTDKQLEIHGSLKAHFEAMPFFEDFTQVESIEDVRPAIELYNALIKMELYDAAIRVFHDRIGKAIFYRLSTNYLVVELLEPLFLKGMEQLLALSSKSYQYVTMSILAMGYAKSGLPGKANPLYEDVIEMCKSDGHKRNQAVTLSNLSGTLRLTGKLFKAEVAASKGLLLARDFEEYYSKGINTVNLGVVKNSRGVYKEAKTALTSSIKLAINKGSKQNEGASKADLSEILLLNSEYKKAKKFANEAWELAVDERNERDFIRAAYCQGLAALRLQDFKTAEERLHHALKRVRAVQAVDEELKILNALAEFYVIKNEPTKAKEYLDEVWDYAEQGPYPLLHADALNILAQLEILESNKPAAIEAATLAYKKAWCDGPPYAYNYGLENAKRLLKQLGAAEPPMPEFDASKFEPMPEVKIDPEGEIE